MMFYGLCYGFVYRPVEQRDIVGPADVWFYDRDAGGVGDAGLLPHQLGHAVNIADTVPSVETRASIAVFFYWKGAGGGREWSQSGFA